MRQEEAAKEAGLPTTSITTRGSSSGLPVISTATATGVETANAAIRSAVKVTGILLGSNRIGALGLEMTHLLAIHALHARHVARLGALLTGVSHLITVAALDVGRVARLSALLRNVALLTAVAATTRTSLGAVLGEMSHLVALAALDTLGRARLGAIGDLVTRLAAVLAGELVDAGGRAITDTMTDLVAVVALDEDALNLNLLLGAASGHVTKFIAILALGHVAGHQLAGISQALVVLFLALGPTFALTGTLGLELEAVCDGILFADLTLKVHVCESRNGVGLLQGNEPNTSALLAEGLLEILISASGVRLDVDLHGVLDIVDVALSDGSGNHLPGLIDGLVLNVITVDDTSVLTSGGSMT